MKGRGFVDPYPTPGTDEDTYFNEPTKPTEEDFGPPITKFPGTQRESILEEARGYVTRDRNAEHGEPEDNFANIARFWNAWLFHRLRPGEVISPYDVAEMMSLMKKGRKITNPDNRDNHADDIGYTACGWEVIDGSTGGVPG